MQHYEGPKDEERLVRGEYPDGQVEYYEGPKGAEHVVRKEYADGRVETAPADGAADDPNYAFGVLIPGHDEARASDRDGPGPSRATLLALFEQGLKRKCTSKGVARVAIESALRHDDEGLFYVLNANGEFVGGATVEEVAFPWDPDEWMGKLVETDSSSGAAADSSLTRYRKAKAHRLTFSLNEVCTSGIDPGELMERRGANARDANRPRGAGKALVRGIRAFVEASYVQPMARRLGWKPVDIRAWCFFEAEVVDTALWFWKERLKFVTDPGVVPMDEGVFPMYRPLFSLEGADHVPSSGLP